MTKNKQTESSNSDQYWQDVENKVLDPEFLKSEFQEGELDFDIADTTKSRRDFLKIMGFSFTALPLASCLRIPVKKALPYMSKSDTIIPGVANWYATSMDPAIGEALLVKTREGRPIKIEGNELSKQYLGGTSAHTQGSLLSLYDSERKQTPRISGAPAGWDDVDNSLKNALDSISKSGKKIYLYTPTISSPSTLQLINDMKKAYPGLEHVVYEPNSMASILEANKDTFGTATYPQYSFDKADLVVSFSADFLGTWLSPTEFTKQYTSARDILERKDILRHIQVESFMSLTGSNADTRLTLSPENESAVILGLLAYLQRKSGKQLLPTGRKLPDANPDLVIKIGEELWSNRGKSLVVSGSTDSSVQVMINTINYLLGNYGKTLSVSRNGYFAGPDDSAVEKSFSELKNGHVGAVLFWNVNPLHDYYNKEQLKNDVAKAKVRASFNVFPDETSAACTHILPTNYYLESWSDYLRSPGILSFSQPVIQPIFATRMFQESLLKLMGKSDYYKYLQDFVRSNFFSKQSKYLTFTDFWNHTVHNGLSEINYNFDSLSMNTGSLAGHFANCLSRKSKGNFTLVTYQSVGLRNGNLMNNPWLQECPDPVTKATWDNYALINPGQAREMGLKTGSVVELSNNGQTVNIPVVLQPGVSRDTVAVAVGYGRKSSGKAGNGVGSNIAPLLSFNGSTFDGTVSGISIKSLNKNHMIALTQTHHSMEGRNLVRDTGLKEYLSNPKSGNEETIKLISMWSGHDKKGQQWAMVIDLSKCTGCSGCIVSCNAENNVPVVGKQEVYNRREMHWMRIDRYYKGDENQPEVVHQPVMCQHCDNAPCETVCPVLATVQSSDGLNQQVYNRCVGTRYCANNCPYKVRRFNWFDYPHKDKYENMVLNPDVVVRSRGVMEKCSMCIQRIQEGKLAAKKEGREVQDGEIKLACQQSCPGDAIVFGDLNDKNSRVSKLLKHPRNYRLLEEINIQPRVSYLTKVRNKDS